MYPGANVINGQLNNNCIFHVNVPCPESKNKIFSLLVDTGASISLIQRESLNSCSEIIKDKIINIKGITKSESMCKTIGHVHLQLCLGNQTVVHPFHVINDKENFLLDYDGFIGNDLLKKVNAKICYESNTISLNGNFMNLFSKSYVFKLSP